MPSSEFTGEQPPAPALQRAGEMPLPAKTRVFDPKELLSRLWVQNLPIMRDRMDSLDAAAQEALNGTLSAARRTQASDIAHKLAGSLGMFGYPTGTEISRDMETLLEADGPIDPVTLARLTQRLRSVLPL